MIRRLLCEAILRALAIGAGLHALPISALWQLGG
jgi:hypothetical protein